MLGFNKLNIYNLFYKESYTTILPIIFLFFGAIFGGKMLKLKLESLKLNLFLTEIDFNLILFLVLYGLTIMLGFIDIKSNY